MLYQAAAFLLVTLLLAITIVASEPAEVQRPIAVTLPVGKRLGGSSSPDPIKINPIQQDRVHVTALKARADAFLGGMLDRRGSAGINVTAQKPTSTYIATVGVGSPPTNYDLLVDLSTSNIWVGADKPWKPTNHSFDTGEPVGLYSAARYWNGEEWLDTVDLGSGLIITNQSIAVAWHDETSGYDVGIDGVLGLAPTILSLGTLWNQPNQQIPTVTNNLYDQGTVPEYVLSMSFAPSTTGIHSGELIFGGTDSRKYTGQIFYTPFSTVPPASLFWSFDQSISYGNKTILKQGHGFVDSINNHILIACDAFAIYKNGTGGVEDEATQMLRLSSSQYNNLQNLNFDIGTTTLSLTPNGQIWPRALNSYISGSKGAIYSIIASLRSPSGLGMDFVLGQSFLERFYTVLDTTHGRVGFATTRYTEATIN